MNTRELITVTVALCIGLGAVSGVGGAIYVCQVQASNCLEAWKTAGTGALASAMAGGTLLAQLDPRKRDPEDPKDAAEPQQEQEQRR